MRVTLIAVLAACIACGDNIDSAGRSHGFEDRITEWLTSQGALHGTVYRCESGADCAGKPEEWCWVGEESDLEMLVGGDCWEIRPEERLWPWLVGCAWCPAEGPGCNAHCGCAGCS